ncbi:MAG: hypothetical protein HY833_00455 [Candidatus Aenigmarchaeota archaeon]|nr:hypothetical protein [Candidatus Aenigmarchaeota archaeon]
MVFEASRKFFFAGPRTAKNFDEAYNIYVRGIHGEKEEEKLTFLYKSAVYKIFLENGYSSADDSLDVEKSGPMSFKKDGGVYVEINKVKVSPNNKVGSEGGESDLGFHVHMEGAYGMDFPNGKLLEGYKMLDALGNEVRDIFTNKFSKKLERYSGKTGE